MQVEKGFERRVRPFQGSSPNRDRCPASSKSKTKSAKSPARKSAPSSRRAERGSENQPGPIERPLREFIPTKTFTWYWFFWKRSSGWEVFLDAPNHSSFQAARKSAMEGSSHLQKKPGVYEFALTRGGSSKRVKVYAGHSSNIYRRHHENYCAHGSHLLAQLDRAVVDGMTVLRRVRYARTTEEAKSLESKLLASFDYAWNKVENGSKRNVALEQTFSLLCLPGPLKVTNY